MDKRSLTDPFVVLFKKNIDEQWEQIGLTEIIHDNLNPQFVKKIIVDYHFEEQEHFKAEVYDSENANQELNNLGALDDFIGSFEF